MSRSKKKQALEALEAVKNEKSKALEAIKSAEILGKPKKKRKGKGLTVLVLGAIVALAVSGELRSKVLDALFGSEEEFDYTSTTAPSSPAPAAA